MRVVVVGASLAGLRAAEQLRAAGHGGPVTVIGAEPHLPYNRPPLSKEVLHDQASDEVPAQAAARVHAQLAFRRRASVADVEFRLGRKVVAADLAARTATLDDGTEAPYDGLVAATGVRSRRLQVPGPSAGRHAIRTLDDALAVRAAVHAGAREVVVVGAGFIGCEAAASLRRLGLAVTVVEAAPVPLGRVVGDALGAALQRHLEAAGVRFVLGTGVARFIGDGRVSGVETGDGSVLPADLVIEAVGSVCNTEWLDGNGLDLADGILADNDLRAADRLVVVGDVARFPNPLFDDVPRRVEHWSMPTDTAKRAALTLVAAMTGAPPPADPFTPVPSFWSDLLDLRLQSYGSPALGAPAVEEGSLDALPDGVLVTYHRAGRHVGSVAINLSPARQRRLREAFTLAPTA